VTAAFPAHLRSARGTRASSPLLAAVIAVELALTVVGIQAPPELLLVIGGISVGVALLAAVHLALPAAERGLVLILSGAGFLVRLLVMLLLHYAAIAPGNPHGLLAPDSFGYDGVGWLLAQHWRNGRPPELEQRAIGLTLGYHYMVAGIYTVVGHAPLLIKILNMLLSTSLIPLTFLVGHQLAGRRAGFTAALLIAFWPPVVFWSVQILKDVVITFLLLVATLGWIAFARRPRLSALALALGPAFPLSFLRMYIFGFWMVGVGAGLAAIAVRSRRLLPAAAVLGMMAAGGWWVASPAGALWFQSQENWVAKLSSISGGAGSVFEGVTFESPRDVVAFLPLGVARFLVTPLPWKAGLHAPEVAGAVLRYALMPFAAVGLLHLLAVKRLAVIPIVVCWAVTLLLYAAAFRGGIPRHWIQFYPYFLVFAAAGLPRWPNWPLPMALGAAAFLILGAAITLG
jgi:hypothetical protein